MWYDALLNRGLIPDVLIRQGIRGRLAQKLREEKSGEGVDAFVRELKHSPIAICTDDANEQHYELPAEFFKFILGPYLKYSSGYWPEGVTDLGASEKAMLELYFKRADIQDGQRILDLGCGWGSFSLYAAESFPQAQIIGVSNSSGQRLYIESEIKKRHLNNLEIITADMNTFEAPGIFDRIVSVEMFEHMRNYEKFFKKIAGWMKPDAKMFVHIFCHDHYAYPYEANGPSDWMARYFFSGGIMPSFELFSKFNRDLTVQDSWRIPGGHYQKTCEAWLKKMDKKRNRLMPLLEATYGVGEAKKWWAYWRIFFMACAELFGYNSGKEWFVGHYLATKNEKKT